MGVSPKTQFKHIIRVYAIILAGIIVLSVAGIFYAAQTEGVIVNQLLQQILWVVSLLFLLVIPLGLNIYKRKTNPVNFGDPLNQKLSAFRKGFYRQMVLLLFGVLVNIVIMIITSKLFIALQIALIAGAATMGFPSLPRMQKDLKLGQNDIKQFQD